MFQGYLALGGTEIINQARTTAYVHHALPMLDLRECDGCDDFHDVMGHDPYESPLVDQPDWFDDTNVDSYDFYGLYPLAVEGFDDGTTTATVTELMGPGAAISVPRRASRQLRVSGLLVGRTDAALSYGMVWLRNALLGNSCSDQLACTGDHLCYFTACPPVCSDSPDYPTQAVPGRFRDCENGIILDPISQCTAPYERVLYDVTVVDAPRVVEQYPSGCAQYWRVEFTLVAATPSPIGIARRAVSPGDITRPPVLIPEVSCASDGGVTERRNFMPSPIVEPERFEWIWGAELGDRYSVNLDVLPPIETSGTPGSLVDEVQTNVGSSVMSQLDEVGINRITLNRQVTPIQASPGLDVTASVYVRSSRASTASIWFDYLSQNGTQLGSANPEYLELIPNEWGRLSVTFNAPEGSAYLLGHVNNAVDGTANVGDTTWWAAGLLEVGEATQTYFDGNTPSTERMKYEWSGPVNRSTSVAERIVDNLPIIVDPDCAVIPDPPRAPEIVDSCIEEAVQWRRYQYVLEPDLVPVWSDALPYVQISAGAIAVRQIRIRFYPNPLNLDLGDLEPCNFCGEFIVSYIPPNSVLTVDGIRQTAYMTSPGGIVRAASHLLYASDGGPIEWSELSCGLEYTMTVDVVPTLIQGLETTLCLAARE